MPYPSSEPKSIQLKKQLNQIGAVNSALEFLIAIYNLSLKTANDRPNHLLTGLQTFAGLPEEPASIFSEDEKIALKKIYDCIIDAKQRKQNQSLTAADLQGLSKPEINSALTIIFSKLNNITGNHNEVIWEAIEAEIYKNLYGEISSDSNTSENSNKSKKNTIKRPKDAIFYTKTYFKTLIKESIGLLPLKRQVAKLAQANFRQRTSLVELTELLGNMSDYASEQNTDQLYSATKNLVSQIFENIKPASLLEVSLNRFISEEQQLKRLRIELNKILNTALKTVKPLLHEEQIKDIYSIVNKHYLGNLPTPKDKAVTEYGLPSDNNFSSAAKVFSQCNQLLPEQPQAIYDCITGLANAQSTAAQKEEHSKKLLKINFLHTRSEQLLNLTLSTDPAKPCLYLEDSDDIADEKKELEKAICASFATKLYELKAHIDSDGSNYFTTRIAQIITRTAQKITQSGLLKLVNVHEDESEGKRIALLGHAKEFINDFIGTPARQVFNLDDLIKFSELVNDILLNPNNKEYPVKSQLLGIQTWLHTRLFQFKKRYGALSTHHEATIGVSEHKPLNDIDQSFAVAHRRYLKREMVKIQQNSLIGFKDTSLMEQVQKKIQACIAALNSEDKEQAIKKEFCELFVILKELHNYKSYEAKTRIAGIQGRLYHLLFTKQNPSAGIEFSREQKASIVASLIDPQLRMQLDEDYQNTPADTDSEKSSVNSGSNTPSNGQKLDKKALKKLSPENALTYDSVIQQYHSLKAYIDSTNNKSDKDYNELQEKFAIAEEKQFIYSDTNLQKFFIEMRKRIRRDILGGTVALSNFLTWQDTTNTKLAKSVASAASKIPELGINIGVKVAAAQIMDNEKAMQAQQFASLDDLSQNMSEFDKFTDEFARRLTLYYSNQLKMLDYSDPDKDTNSLLIAIDGIHKRLLKSIAMTGGTTNIDDIIAGISKVNMTHGLLGLLQKTLETNAPSDGSFTLEGMLERSGVTFIDVNGVQHYFAPRLFDNEWKKYGFRMISQPASEKIKTLYSSIKVDEIDEKLRVKPEVFFPKKKEELQSYSLVTLDLHQNKTEQGSPSPNAATQQASPRPTSNNGSSAANITSLVDNSPLYRHPPSSSDSEVGTSHKVVETSDHSPTIYAQQTLS